AQRAVPARVPPPGGLPDAALRPWAAPGLGPRHAPRPLLPRLLLGAHARDVRGRRRQPRLDGRARRRHARREDPALGPPARPLRRRRPGSLGIAGPAAAGLAAAGAARAVSLPPEALLGLTRAKP